MINDNNLPPLDKNFSASDQNYDVDNLNDILKKCVAPFVVCSKDLARFGVERDDIYQEAWIALINALRTFDSTKEISFKTYAGVCIRNRIISFLKSNSGKKFSPLNDSVSIDSEFFDGLVNSSDIADKLSDPESEFITNETNRLLKIQISTILSDFEFKVLTFYLNGLSYDTMAHLLSTSTKAVDNALQRTRSKLKSVKFGI